MGAQSGAPQLVAKGNDCIQRPISGWQGHFEMEFLWFESESSFGGRIAITSAQLTVVRGQNSTIMECSVDRSVGNTGNAMVGFKVNGFILLSVVYNGNKHVKWFMLSERPQNNKIEMKECTAVQSAMLSRISREQHHTMVHIGSENGWEHHALVPRSTKTVTKATPLPTKGTWSESIVKERLSCQGVTFEKLEMLESTEPQKET